MNVIYDMNGRKAPNHAGEDIGIVTVFWSGLKSVAVAPGIIPYKEAKALFDEGAKSVSNGKLLCEQHSYVLPDIDEIASLVLNQKFSSTNNGSYFWSRTPVSGKQGYSWIVVVHTRSHLPSYYGSSIWCVRR